MLWWQMLQLLALNNGRFNIEPIECHVEVLSVDDVIDGVVVVVVAVVVVAGSLKA